MIIILKRTNFVFRQDILLKSVATSNRNRTGGQMEVIKTASLAFSFVLIYFFFIIFYCCDIFYETGL